MSPLYPWLSAICSSHGVKAATLHSDLTGSNMQLNRRCRQWSKFYRPKQWQHCLQVNRSLFICNNSTMWPANYRKIPACDGCSSTVFDWLRFEICLWFQCLGTTQLGTFLCTPLLECWVTFLAGLGGSCLEGGRAVVAGDLLECLKRCLLNMTKVCVVCRQPERHTHLYRLLQMLNHCNKHS